MVPITLSERGFFIGVEDLGIMGMNRKGIRSSFLFIGLVLATVGFIPASLALAGHISSEIDISAVNGSDPRQYYPHTAYDNVNGNFLVVWKDKRCVSRNCIYGARVRGSDGAILDPGGFLISNYLLSDTAPVVAFDGENFLVAFVCAVDGHIDIVGVRVRGSDAKILAPGPFHISTSSSSERYPSIAFDGTNYLVVWSEWRDSATRYDVYGTRFSREGVVLDGLGIPISTASNHQLVPSVAFDGTNYLVVWSDMRNGATYDIYGTRVRPDGVVLDPFGIPISTASNHQVWPKIAFDGTNYLVVWQDYRNHTVTTIDIYGARVSREGVVLDSEGISISNNMDWQMVPSVAFDGTNYLVLGIG